MWTIRAHSNLQTAHTYYLLTLTGVWGATRVTREWRDFIFVFSYPPPLVSFSVECVCWFWVGRSDWKKSRTKKFKTSRNERPGNPASSLWSLETTRHKPKKEANSHVESVTPFHSMILSCQRSPYLINIQLRWLLHRKFLLLVLPRDINNTYLLKQFWQKEMAR